MKKHILCVLLCLCMLLTLMPTAILAENSTVKNNPGAADSVTVGGVNLTADKPYLANGASSARADQPASGGYAFFDTANGTLTLHNAAVEDDAWPLRTSYGIYCSGDLSIVLEGTNTVKGDGVAGSYDSYGIYCNGDVTISGDSVTIEGGAVAGTAPISCGIYCEGTIKIVSGSVTVKAGSYAMNKAPITPDTGYTVKTADYSSNTPTGDFVPGKIAEYKTVQISPTFAVLGGVTLNDSTPYLANGASAAVADRPSSDGYAHFDAHTRILTLHNSIINGAASSNDNYGIYAVDDLTIALEGSNSITADDATFDDFFTTWRGDSIGIYLQDKALTISGTGSLTVNAGKGASSYGIYADGVTITDGATVYASAGCADASGSGMFYSCGIFSNWEACTFSDGAIVTAVGGETESTSAKSIGISAWMSMTVNGADITATGNTTALKPAPTVTDGTITVATDVSGNDIVAYDKSNLDTYKYFKVTPGTAQAQWGIAGESGSEPTSWMMGDFSAAVDYANRLTDQTAYIKLLSDVNNAYMYVENGGAVILDLNGKTLDRGLSSKGAKGDGSVIAVNGGTLTIKDSGIGGKITGGNSTYGAGGGVTVRWGGALFMESGIITGNSAAYGGGVFVAQSSADGRDSLFCMSGGSITGNNSTVYGGGVRIAENSAMTVSGAAVIRDNFKDGTLSGGVYVQGTGEKSNAVLNGKAVTVSGPLTGSIGIVKEDDYMAYRHTIRIAVSDTSYAITQSDATAFTSDSNDCITAYCNTESEPAVLLKISCTLTYDANGATSGAVPTGTSVYGSGDTVTVADNSGNLQKTCHTFVGWNTKADGTGDNYTAGSGIFNISNDTILYAAWAEAHTGGKATCKEKAVCEVCGQAYGSLASHSTSKIPGQAASCTADGWKDCYQCTVCNRLFSDEACTQEITSLDGWKNGDGKIAAVGHIGSSDWSYDETDHWKICTVAGCGVVIEAGKAAHTPDRAVATENDPIKCSVCGYVITPALEHIHNVDTAKFEFDTTNHWNTCSGCGEKHNAGTHEFDWVIDKDSTATEKGSKHEECKVCGYKKATVEIPATGIANGQSKPEKDNLNTETQVPDTGDNSHVGIYIAMMLFALAGVAATIILGKKKSRITK